MSVTIQQIRETFRIATLNRNRRKMPAPYNIPSGGQGLFMKNEQDVGVPINNYIIKIFSVNRDEISMEIKKKVDGFPDSVKEDISGVVNWHIAKSDRQQSISLQYTPMSVY